MNFFRRSELGSAFEEQIRFYDQTVRNLVGKEYPYPIRMRDWELHRILSAIKDAGPESSVLDVGSFNTYLGAFLSRRHTSVTVSDVLGQRLWKSLQRKFGLAPKKPSEAFYFDWKRVMSRSGVVVRSLDATSMDCRDGSFDIVIALSVIEHIPDIERAISELYRVTAPGGKLLITTDCAASAKPYQDGVRYFSKFELDGLFKSYPVTSICDEPDFSKDNWCYDLGYPVVTAFIEISKPKT